MIGPFALLHVGLAGFFLCAALYAAWTWWLARDDRTLLLCSLQALLWAALSISFTRIAAAQTADAVNSALGLRVISSLLAMAVTGALIARITGVRAKTYVRVGVAIAVTASVAHVALQPMRGHISLHQMWLPWGEVVSIPEWEMLPWWGVPLYGYVLSVYVFGLYGAWRLSSRDRLAGALVALATGGGLVTSLAAFMSDRGYFSLPYFGNLPCALWVLLVIGHSSREHSRMRREQAASQQRLRAIFEHTLHYMGLLDIDGGVLEANRPMLDMIGVPADAVLGKPFWQTPLWAHCPELAERVRLAVVAAAGGDVVRFETWHPLPDGAIRYLDSTLKPIKDEGGRVILLLPEGRDITARKKTQEALDRLVDVVAPRTGQDFFQTMVDTLCEICDVDIVIVGSIDANDETMLRTIAMSNRGKAAPAVPYALNGTPCETVVGRDLCYYATNVQALFPEDAMLADLSADAYMGIPIGSGDGNAVGMIALLRSSPIRRPEQAKALLQVVAARAGAELERRRTDAALQESESRFRTLIEDLDVGVVMQDAHDRVLVSNPAAARMLGLGDQALHGLSAQDRRWALVNEDGTPCLADGLPWTVAARTRQTVRNAVVGGTGQTGGRTWLQVTAMPHMGGDNVLQHVLVTIVDVTDRKRAEDAVRASSRRLSLAISATSDAVWEWNYETGETYFSPRWFEMLSLSPDLPNTVDTFISHCHPDDLEATLDRIDAAVREHQAWAVEFRMRRGDGTWAWVLSRGSAVESSADGQPLMLAGTNTDITPRKEAEARRRELELRLAQSQRMESMGRLAGGIAHDFNNILTVINGYSDLLLHTARLEPSAAEMLRDVRSAGDRAAALTRQLLTFSRSQVVSPDILDLNAVVADTERMLQRLIGEHITLTTSLGERPLWVRADTSQLGQVIVNLAVNARDAMPSGGTLAVSTSAVTLDAAAAASIDQEAAAGAYAVLRVSDTGTGIPEELQEVVLEPFFTTKGPGKGTGLGLTTVHSIVRQSGGYLLIQSSPGAGSTFTIYLPSVAPPSTERRRPADHAIDLREQKTVLMVEDESAVRSVAQVMLRRMGFEVLVAGDAEEALRVECSFDRPIDLLVTDVIMPGFNGRELAERLSQRRPGLRVLYMSGYTDDALVQRGVLDDAVTYLQKPFDAEALAVKVRQAFEAAPPAGAH